MNNSIKKVAYHNLGCKVNSYEMDLMLQELKNHGYELVEFAPGADIYIINTCTVTNIADRKSRQLLHRAKKQNPDAIVVAVGCYVQTAGENGLMDDAIDLAVGNNKKTMIVELLEEYIKNREKDKDKTLGGRSLADVDGKLQYEDGQLLATADHTRAFIKIQDGCNSFCSYCIIPYARGRVRSRKPESVILEAENLVKAGFLELVLTGIHISSYGLDFEEDYGLLELLKELNAVEGLKRLRLGSLEPRIITEEFVKELGKLDKICPHFHLSLQSGCDTVLKRMNRHYTSGQYAEGVRLLRQGFLTPAITTDVIVGFPGESSEEFEETCRFLTEQELYELHIFKYSRRKGTAADKMPGQLTENEKHKRSLVLQELTDKQSEKFRKSFIGKNINVLFEEELTVEGISYISGLTDTYIRVISPYTAGLEGKLCSCRAVSVKDDMIIVEIL